ncbi:ABC transporter substrate-binding protein [Limnoglobus roseus]|nr:ABC transporter substrate-binding protein [Limnoglobus roseus]
MNNTRSLPRHVRPFLLSFGLLLLTVVVGINGQGQIVPKKTDKKGEKESPAVPGGTGAYAEVEDPKAKKVRESIPIDDEAPVVFLPKGAYYVRIEDLARAAADTPSPPLRALLLRYVVAFDRITDFQDKAQRVTPIPAFRLGKIPPVFGVFDLDDRNQPAALRRMESTKVRKIEHYEELIVEEAERLVNAKLLEPPGVERKDRVEAAEQLLAGALLFHDAARDQSKRKGIGWEQVRAKVADTLSAVRLTRLKLASERKDWALVRSLGSRMTSLYPNNLKLLEEVFTARLAEALLAATESEKPAELENARDLLSEFESRFPGSKSETAESIREALKEKAKNLFEQASVALRQNDQKRAQQLIRTVETIDPGHAGLRDLQGQLTGAYSVLYVGARHLPERMTPLTARFPSERQAVDLIFEPLLEALPDDSYGVKYRPVLANAMPTAAGLSRDFTLVKTAEWAGLGREYLDATDVAGTLKAVRDKYRHTWVGEYVDWMPDPVRVEDHTRLRINFASGHPFPLAMMTTKVLPARWLTAENKQLDDLVFALKPVGTGPFRFVGKGQPTDGPTEVVFAANPTFARRAGRIGQPFIKEVHFVDLAKVADPAALFRSGQLHFLPDVPTGELAKFTAPAAKLKGQVDVVTTESNRRIYMLAINHQRPELNSVALRRGLAHAIDREEILDKVYRAGFSQFHKALVGPFPPNSWPIPKVAGSVPPPLFDSSLAQAKMSEYAVRGGEKTLTLLYSTDDARSRFACEMVRKQIETATATAVSIKIALEGLPAVVFHKRVYEDRDFELAYVPFEYRDDWYPYGLGFLLDPEAQSQGGRNFMRYPPRTVSPSREDKLLGQQLEEIRHHADFTGKLSPQAQRLQLRFVEAMPFIPLWQLDRHMVVSTKLKFYLDDTGEALNPKWLAPDHAFAGVARWKLQD